jgi:endoglucanase
MTVCPIATIATIVLFGMAGCGPAASPFSASTPVLTAAVDGPLHTVGNRLLDAHGRTVILRGAQIEGYNVARIYRSTQWLDPAAFRAMRSWGMNELRLPFSGCLVTNDQGYVPHLVQLAHEAEDAGLYVVLALFDDSRAGCPDDGVAMPSPEAKAQWATVAAAFRDDRDVLFDLFNEPSTGSDSANEADWATWKDGGSVVSQQGTTVPVLGFDQLASAVRTAGAIRQPVIAEAVDGGPLSGATGHLLADGNVLYSVHTYFRQDLTSQDFDALFGDVTSRLPVFVGEWAFLPNALQPGMCKNLHLSTAGATALVETFLAYLDAHGVSYNAWSFTPTHLIVNEVSFAATTLPDPMVCDPALTHAGMGALYKAHLAGLTASP